MESAAQVISSFFTRKLVQRNYIHSMEVKLVIKKQLDSEWENIEEERRINKNISLAMDSPGKFGEKLATYIFSDSIGSASKGGCAFDNNCRTTGLKREVKTCCLVQPKICLTCESIKGLLISNFVMCPDCVVINKCTVCQRKTLNKCLNCEVQKCARCISELKKINSIKVPYFQQKCLYCGSTSNDNFKEVRDTRFAIDCKSHFEFREELFEYLFNIIDYKDGKIILESFIVPSSNQYFDKLLRKQLEGGTKTCNLMPKRHDFYSSGPIKIIHAVYNEHQQFEEFWFDAFNKKICDYPAMDLRADLRLALKLPKNHEFLSRDRIPYGELEEVLVPKKKNLGRERGKTKRIG